MESEHHMKRVGIVLALVWSRTGACVQTLFVSTWERRYAAVSCCIAEDCYSLLYAQQNWDYLLSLNLEEHNAMNAEVTSCEYFVFTHTHA
jgi:hypothetical protein